MLEWAEASAMKDEFYEDRNGRHYRVIGRVKRHDNGKEYLATHAFTRDGEQVTDLFLNSIVSIVGVDPETDEWHTIECEICH